MASSKQQNLLVPLIVFVVLTVVSGVAAFMFYQKATKLDTDLANQKKQADEANQKRTTADANLKTLKNLIGYPDAEFGAETDLAGGNSLISKIREDLTKYVDPGTPPSATYKGEVDRLAQRRDDVSKELDSKNAAYTRLRDEFDSTRKSEEGKINENVSNFQESKADLEKVHKEVEQKLAENRRVIEDREATAQRHATDKLQVENEYENFRKRSEINTNKMVGEIKLFRESQQKLQAAGTPVAQVVRVDNVNNEVYIDRGSDDLLPMQTTFSIWSADKRGSMHWREKNEKVKGDAKKEWDESGKKNSLETRLEGGPKAYIEIVSILGPHHAKGRITMEKNLDPIVPGDSLFTPLWEPGQRKHFALAGRFDMTSKGTNDRSLLVDLIKRQGGIIDAEVRDNGTVDGNIGVETHYLVIGDLTDEVNSSEQQKENSGRIRQIASELQKEAKSLGVEVIDQNKLYDFMGYKRFARKYELGDYTGGPEPKNRFENPSQSTRPTGLRAYDSTGASSRPSGIPGQATRKPE